MPVEGDQYPVNLILEGKRCLVVGAGAVAARKVAGLLACRAVVHVIATSPGPELASMAESDLSMPDPRITIETRPYRPGDIGGYRLVIAATDDPLTNRAIFDEAEAAGIWINSADDPASCTFTLPSVVRRGPIMVTVSTGGRSPALARWIKSRLEEYLGPEYELLLHMLSAAREDMRASGRSTEEVDWQSLLDSDMLDLIKAGHASQARERLQSWLSSSSD